MDGDDGYEEIKPQRHSKWHVLILATSYMANVLKITGMTLDGATDMIVAHASQLDYDRRFKEITHGHPSIGTGTVQQED